MSELFGCTRMSQSYLLCPWFPSIFKALNELSDTIPSELGLLTKLVTLSLGKFHSYLLVSHDSQLESYNHSLLTSIRASRFEQI